MSTLQRYRWPGNVREMRNVLERLMIMVPGDTIATSDLSFLDGAAQRGARREAPCPVPLHEARDAFERDYILRALAGQQGNISRTADVLGVERSNLYRKMRALRHRAGAGVSTEEEVAARALRRLSQLLLEDLVVAEPLELQVELRRADERRRRARGRRSRSRES